MTRFLLPIALALAVASAAADPGPPASAANPAQDSLCYFLCEGGGRNCTAPKCVPVVRIPQSLREDRFAGHPFDAEAVSAAPMRMRP